MSVAELLKATGPVRLSTATTASRSTTSWRSGEPCLSRGTSPR